MHVSEQLLCELGLTKREANRLASTLALIPNTVVNALEIGFYDLRITSLLRKKIDLISIDLPRRVNNADKIRLVFANVRSLPFLDRQFDLVLCTEVLEHLATDTLVKAVAELIRVSRKYVLVSVPFKQKIEYDMFKCSHCNFTGNTMGHVQLFDEARLLELFKPMDATRVEMIGHMNGRAPGFLYRASRRLGNVWYDYSFGSCPACGKTDRAVRENALGYIMRRVIWRFERRAATQPAWIAMLFRRGSE
jgi:hypothetical protein